ncbi:MULTISPECIES: Ppx/GppA phosphatase family protein [Thermoanaerobacterium]|uniref:Ppx/GppA phosphatase n=2 Tax=Thermoanaerobacterium TaxID=28895 RepID=W9EAI8_9THEO|nr:MULTISPECIES: Ppx/GppA phosphatase family protein [Thermoanaerobacterium]AFK85851.1 Ppx/GppA phosphatase [Thermoanaerobacterium saccharolyticum JW/SL-YS485]ETO37940.1 Ppx/GppA phosphatase [Thermoanaerobacterium aotearoense SCUT27]
MRCSVIDIGTNSVRHLVCDVDGENIKHIKKDVKITRLGDSVSKNAKLSTDAIGRTANAIKAFLDDAENLKVQDIYAFATSAVRDAKNADSLINELTKLGINVDIIDGETESLYGYIGVSYGTKKDNVLVLDVGGGSTEFSYLNENLVKKSFDIGALRLTEKFVKNDPISIDEYNNISLYITDMLTPFISENREIPTDIVVIGGTITTLAAMSQDLKMYSRELVHGYVLSKSEIKRLLDLMMSLSLDERRLLNGLQPERADIIVAGTIIVYTILKLLNCTSITVSEWDNLEGALVEKYIKETNGKN